MVPVVVLCIRTEMPDSPLPSAPVTLPEIRTCAEAEKDSRHKKRRSETGRCIALAIIDFSLIAIDLNK
jgi:hypothetical protein